MHCFLHKKTVTQRVRIFVYKNLTEIASFFGYKNLTVSALFFVYKNALPFANFKNSMKNCVTQSVKVFEYKKCNANCLAFFEVSGFLYCKDDQDSAIFSR